MISAIVNTCNEEKYLERCLEHLKWADEIVIVDMYSTDKSIEIARKYTDKIYFHERTLSVLYARNFSLSKAQGNWLLVVDPDEVIPQGLANKFIEIANSNPDFVAAAFPLRMVCFGKEFNYVYPLEWKIRFFKKGYVSFPRRVHAHPKVSGDIYFLPKEEKYIANHYVAENIFRFVEKMNRYTSDEAKHMYEDDGIKYSILYLIKKPLAEFKNRFFIRRGYKDGIEGFIFSVLMATYRFLTYAKLREISKK
jgi:glycosyltransferase involved in cell wall biosynthesis